jgi:hypothetical protein
MRQPLRAGQAWAGKLPAGGTIEMVAAAPGAGVAWFAWSSTDPFEQVSDAYTFMELRQTHPRVGDCLFSTLRRPLLTLLRDDVSPGLDLLRHDAWFARETALELLGAATPALPCPLAADWPFALNVFARTMITPDGRLVPQPALAYPGAAVTLRAAADLTSPHWPPARRMRTRHFWILASLAGASVMEWRGSDDLGQSVLAPPLTATNAAIGRRDLSADDADKVRPLAGRARWPAILQWPPCCPG